MAIMRAINKRWIVVDKCGNATPVDNRRAECYCGRYRPRRRMRLSWAARKRCYPDPQGGICGACAPAGLISTTLWVLTMMTVYMGEPATKNRGRQAALDA
jgi:hypothetical protein